jgi:hypothetical protein
MRRWAWGPAILIAALIGLTLAPLPAQAQDWTKVEKFWAETKTEAKNWLPDRIEETKEWAHSLRVVRRPEEVITSFEDDPQLWKSLTLFYDYIRGRELDVWAEQQGMPLYFLDRAAYYDFLDTMLPAMRERRFERNRLLEYTVHSITFDPDDPTQADVLMSGTSDDTFPFDKIIVYHHRWLRSPRGWYPGKVEAESATYWEKIR